MTEHDTPSAAHTEAERRMPDRGGPYGHLHAAWRNGFEDGAEWALAQVREGLIMEVGPIFGDSKGVTIKRGDALAVVDRLEGKP